MIIGTAASQLTRHLLVGTALAVTLAATAGPAAAAAAAQESPAAIRFSIPAQDLGTALSQFARQSGQQLLYAPDLVAGRRSNPLVGSFTPREGLMRLLSGSGIGFRMSPSGAYLLGNGAGPAVRANVTAANAAAQDGSADQSNAAEILVVGSRSINADIRRTEDDTQPYVVLSREDIRSSQATTVGEFLMRRLPQNTSQIVIGQVPTGINTANEINLRGLGGNQTLILIDGRRLPGVNLGQANSQPQIEGIPLSIVERIEILPTAASGIYGGGATGGVINIITRRNYSGIDLSLSSGITERGDGFHYRVEGSFGHTFDSGTSILIAASHSGSDPIATGDRDFAVRARQLLLQNNPAAIFSTTTPLLGAGTNIRSSNGSNLILDNGTPLGSPNTFVPTGYPGIGSDGGMALVPNAGRYNLDIPNNPNGAAQTLYRDDEANSATVNIRQEVSPRLELFVDGAWYENRGLSNYAFIPSTVQLQANAPNNPFTTAIRVSFPGPDVAVPTTVKYSTLRGTVGAIGRLGRGWSISADYSYSRARTSLSTFDPPFGSYAAALANGSLDVIRDLGAFPLNFSPFLLVPPTQILGPGTIILQNANTRLSGPLVRLPGGQLTLTAGAEWRHEQARTNRQTFVFALGPGGESTTIYPARSQSVWSGFAELRAPIVSPENDIPFLRELELQASARHDRYGNQLPVPFQFFVATRDSAFPTPDEEERNFSATKYTLGMRLSPVRGLVLRGSYGTGFLPPALFQFAPTSIDTPTSQSLSDPKRGSTLTSINFLGTLGGNPALRPEESRSWSVGAIVAPSFFPNFRLSVDYTHISKTDEILSSLAFQNALNFEDQFPGRVTRNPLTDADRALGYTGGTVAAIDGTAINALRARIEAWDFQVDYSLQTGVGTFSAFAIATYQPHLQRQLLIGTPFVEFAGFRTSILRWRGNGGLSWSQGPVSVQWSTQYYGSYFVYTPNPTPATIATATLNQGSARIRGQFYHDLLFTYRFARNAETSLPAVELMFGVQNLFDTEPAIIAGTGAVGGFSTYGDPRLRRYTMGARLSF